MQDLNLPLRWESTGDQWWYVTPLDYAAANGFSDLVTHFLAFEPNLLIKLTSLSRIRRLESVWDDSSHHNMVAQARARVARALLTGCECSRDEKNPLIRAGYSGWLLYTAASAGDLGFVNELLRQEPSVVFGEGEFGITDILYGAARSKNCEVFRVLLKFAIDVGKCKSLNGGSLGEGFVWEVMNRAVHCAARGGNLEVLKELLLDCGDVLGYRDDDGCSVLHSASARGQVEVVKHLITTYDIINKTDNQGNTALHVAAYRGYTSVVEVLALASPSLATLKNNNGDTFLHMAVAGFLSPGFHLIDQQIELIKQLVNGNVISLKDIINVANSKGRTALHIATAGNIDPNVVELLMTVPLIDLDVCDIDGLTPRDLLKQCRKTASAERDSNCEEHKATNVLISDVRTQGVCLSSTSPGTSFRYPDADLFLCTGSDNDSEVSCEPSSSRFSPCSSELNSRRFDLSSLTGASESDNKSSSLKSGSGRFKFLFKWLRKEEMRKIDNSHDLYKVCRNMDGAPTPLRRKFNKRANLIRGDFASQSTKERFAASLRHGVIQATPPSSRFSPSLFSSTSSPRSPHKVKVEHLDQSNNHNNGSRSSFFSGPLSGVRSQMTDKQHRRMSSLNKSLMNQYLCFGAQALAVEDSVDSIGANRSCRRLVF